MPKNHVVLYVGTYQHHDPSSPRAEKKGIYTYALDPASGRLAYRSEINDIDNPSFLAIHAEHRVLYAVNENRSPGECSVQAYAIDANTGSLRFLNQQLALGALPCHIAIDEKNQLAAVANYGSGSVTLLPIGENGRLLPAADHHQHDGSGPVPGRQEGPHAHCAAFDPTGRYLFVADLGIDKIMSYRLDKERQKLVPNETPYLALPAGSGPRQIKFHPNGRLAYIMNELNSTLTALAYDDARGTLAVQQTVSALPAGFQGHNQGAEIWLSPGGKFLYGSNRGHDSLAIFAIDEETGWLTAVAHQPTRGRSPRHFAVDPSGTFLLVANQDSHNIITFRLNHDTGHLEFVQELSGVPKPVCLQTLYLN